MAGAGFRLWRMSINRVVVFLTPAFVGLSGWLTGLAAKYLPGAPALDSGELAAFMGLGAAAAFGAVWKWLQGWQKHEENEARSAETDKYLAG